MALTIKEMAAHIRDLIKKENIKARVRITAPYINSIQVFTRKYEDNFSAHEQRIIRNIAKCNGLTLVRGMPINVEQMTDPKHFEFYFWG